MTMRNPQTLKDGASAPSRPAGAFAADQPEGRPIPADPAALLHTSEAAYLTTLSKRTLEGLRMKGGGPRFVRIAGRSVRYKRADLDVWMNQRSFTSTSDPGREGEGV